MDRKVFFSDGGVIISDSRFIASGYIYNIQDIQSARLAVIAPPRALAVLSFCIGLLCLLNEGTLFVVGGCAIALGVMTWIFSRTTYAVVLHTATGAHQVFRDSNRLYVEQVIQALDAALANCGVVNANEAAAVHGSANGGSDGFPQMSPSLME